MHEKVSTLPGGLLPTLLDIFLEKTQECDIYPI
jgi:hypothetical protein